MKSTNMEKVSRRLFLRDALASILPIIGALSFPVISVGANTKTIDNESPDYCPGSCTGLCTTSCMGNCKGECKGGCVGDCTSSS